MSPEIFPPGGNDNHMKKVIEDRKSFSYELRSRILSFLEDFEFEPGNRMDVSRHIMNSDIDQALEDSVPMFSFFGLCANKAEDKEKHFNHMMEVIEAQAVKDPKINIAYQKREVKLSENYKKAYKGYRVYRRIRKNCEWLAKAMEKRANLTQTKSSNLRTEQRPGSWATKQ